MGTSAAMRLSSILPSVPCAVFVLPDASHLRPLRLWGHKGQLSRSCSTTVPIMANWSYKRSPRCPVTSLSFKLSPCPGRGTLLCT